MKYISRKAARVLVITTATIIVVVAVVIIFISPLTKYLIEKYDVKWTGREITMDWAYVNPFTGSFNLHNVKIYEENSDSLALASNNVGGNFDIPGLFKGLYHVNELTLDHPLWNVVKDKDKFNFTSFVKHISPDHPDTSTTPSTFNIYKMKIIEGEFHYHQTAIPITYFIKGGNFETNGKLIDADSVLFKFFFLNGPGSGSMQGNFTANFKNLDYHYDVLIHQYDLSPLQQYMNPFMNYGSFTAHLDANLAAKGNFSDADSVTVHGNLSLNNFHFGKNKREDFLAFDNLMLAIDDISPEKKKYLLDSVILYHPYFKYEIYDKLDNLETMFGQHEENVSKAASTPYEFNLIIEIVHYVKMLARDFFSSYYKIDNLAIYKADLRYNDFSMSESFSNAFSPLTITADSINRHHDRVNLYIKSGIEPYGNANVTLSISPQDTGTFDMQYHFQNIPASLFNPYLVSYTSFPLDRGTIEFNGIWHVRGGKINSDNHFVVIDPRVTKRVKKKDAKWLPMPLIMVLIRENGNVIDYDIPITGRLKNPRYHLHDVVWGIVKNIFVKPPLTPYRMEVKNVENVIEKSLTLKWMLRQTNLTKRQENFIDDITNFLAKNKNTTIDVHPEVYAVKEKEYITFFEAKKKYFLAKENKSTLLNEDDSVKVERLSIRDSSFVDYLKVHVKDPMAFSIQDRCLRLVGAALVTAKYKKLLKERENNFLSYFKAKGVDKQVKLHSEETTIPYNGFSYYTIAYNGDIPDALRKAYDKMIELNEEGPRKKFEEERKKDKAPVYNIGAKVK